MIKILIYFFLLGTFLEGLIIPYSQTTNIVALKGNSVTLSNSIGKKGESAIVIRQINGQDYLMAYVKLQGGNRAKIIDTDPLGGNPLANIKPVVKVGDEVKSAFLYDKIMIIAPNKEAFNAAKSELGMATLIKPNLFASYLKGRSPSKSDYKAFAKMVGIGLFAIVKNNKLMLYDPISQETIAQVKINYNNSKKVYPFYSNLSE